MEVMCYIYEPNLCSSIDNANAIQVSEYLGVIGVFNGNPIEQFLIITENDIYAS